jgi:TRAP-type uncharacterized transport system substrate-binding protein
MINPSGLLTQAYRGTGLFSRALPVRIIATYPSLDHFVYSIHPRTGLKSLGEIKDKKYPLRLSIREDATHSTRVLVDQTLAAYGMTLTDIESWGGSLQLNGGPGDERRMKAIADGTIDAVFDEGLVLWLDAALDSGLEPITLEDSVFKYLTDLGWRKFTIQPGRYRSLKRAYTCIDYSGWPLYTRASLPEENAYKICDAIMARKEQIYWEDSFSGVGQLGEETDATPRDVPLHPGAIQWYRDHGYKV